MTTPAHQMRRRADTMTEEELDMHFSACPAFHSHTDGTTIHTDLQEIKQTLVEMKEIAAAWHDAKGFIRMICLIGEVLKWSVAVGAAVLFIWYAITGSRGK